MKDQNRVLRYVALQLPSNHGMGRLGLNKHSLRGSAWIPSSVVRVLGPGEP